MTENEVIKKIINENTQIAIGNLTAIKLICKKFENAEETIDMAIQVLEKVQQFESIGTIEEFKALKEKNVSKKPRFYAHNYYCTECGNLVGNNEFEWQRFLYCDKCGQKLDWQ